MEAYKNRGKGGATGTGANFAGFVIILLMTVGIARAETITVGHGLGYDFDTIQAAIDSANDGDEVVVADGTYTGTGNRNIDFLGKAVTVRSENGPENCIIDCNGTEADPHRGFNFRNNEDANSVLDGFTITKGYAEFSGAGIDCRNANPTINNCTITGNVSRDGAAVVCYWSSAMVINCTVVENTDKGIACFGGTIITNCVINENTNNGIWCYEDTTISNCTISENEDDGVNCAETTVNSCTVTGNGGAGIWCEDNVIIRNCVIGENNRGGVVFDGHNSEVIGSLIACNKSWSGAGIRCAYKRGIRVTNCTISDNTAEENGGGIFCEGSTVLVSDCILWGDIAPIGSEICIIGNEYWPSGLSAEYSNVEGGEDSVYVGSYGSLNWAQGNIEDDPLFVDRDDGKYYLSSGSPCVDAGDANYVAAPNETDLDGNRRVIDGDEDGIVRIDMGAYEFVPIIDAVVDIQPETLNLASRGKWVKAHFVLPAGIVAEDVDVNEPAIANPPDVASEYIKVFDTRSSSVKLEIAFDRQTFCEGFAETVEVEVSITGSLESGQYFRGADTIRVVEKARKKD